MNIYFEVGQIVWSPLNGWGMVEMIHNSDNYPVRVSFDNGLSEIFSLEGKLRHSNLYPSLFQEEGVIGTNKPLVTFKEGDLVWVRVDDYSVWQVRVFSYASLYRCYCYDDQKREGAVSFWEQCKPFTDIPF